MRKSPILLVILGILVLLPGCRRDATGPGNELTERETRNLMPNFLAASWRAMEKYMAEHAADAGLNSSVLNHVEPCPRGGEIRLQGTVTVAATQTAGTRSLTMEGVKTPLNCTYTEEGRTYVLSGLTPLTVRGTGTITGNQPGSSQVSETGTFDWRIDDRSGSCSVTLSATIDTRTRSGLLAGTACRRSLNDSIAWPALIGN